MGVLPFLTLLLGELLVEAKAEIFGNAIPPDPSEIASIP
jgi:hypothetical protein